ncbi:MAG: hypothetical protein Q9N62_11965 [Ghiorsea sp.]|nr:hypothetical protein [Ghiorsea sp.]
MGTYSRKLHVTLVKAGYAAETDTVANVEATTNTIVVGALYDVAQNFSLDLEYTSTTANTGVAGAPDLASTSTTLLFEYVY